MGNLENIASPSSILSKAFFMCSMAGWYTYWRILLGIVTDLVNNPLAIVLTFLHVWYSLVKHGCMLSLLV